MYTNSILAVSGALLSVVAAVPMAKRDIVWVTEIEEDIVTVPVTKTVWVNPYETASSHYGHHWHSKSTVTSHVQSTVTVSASPASKSDISSSESTSEAPAPSSAEVPTTRSVYVAPTTTSTSEYVAPTTSSVYVAPTTSSVYVAPTTSSVYVAPTTTSTSEYVAPTTSSTPVYVAPTTTSAAPVASTSASSSSGSGSGLSSGLGAAGTSYTGDMTWYADGLGACGMTNGPSDHIVAVSHVIFDSYAAESTGDGSNGNPICGKYVSIVGVDGSTYSAEVVDRCVGCLEGDLDLSEDFFNTVTSNGDGRVHDISWTFA